MATIRFNCGNSTNLPTLSAGEMAFANDTNHLFVGEGTYNLNMTPIQKNLLINSNFQVPLESTDSTSASNNLSNGTGRYIFGVYYLYNDASSLGVLSYSIPTETNQLITFNSGSIPGLNYQVKLMSDNYSYLDGTTVTLSFDSQSTSAVQFSAGIPWATVTRTIPVGYSRNSVTFTFNATTLSGKSAPSFNITLFKANAALPSALSIGNFKLEVGSIATSYSANSLSYDVSMLKEHYFIIIDGVRNSDGVYNKLFFYYFCKSNIYNIPPQVKKVEVSIYNLSGSKITYYSDSNITVSYNSTLKLI